ncbi:MAG: hypothetical protein IJP66_03210, partial [Kiritimatiellae bacterium]|nr:hypothetical protein [Kiritimatiellia bacterium]
LTLCGPGPDGLGAVRNVGSAKQTKIFNNGGSLALSGDATIGGANLGLSTATAKPPVNLNGHSFTVAMDSGASLTLSASSFATAGDIVIAAGRLLLNGATVWTGGAENTVTVRNGAQLGFYDVANPVPWSLALENGSSIYPQYGDVEADATPNVWAGPVTVASGRVDVYYSDSASTGVHFSGPVGGAGGFRLAGATALRLSCPTNTFANGVVLNGASTTAGGLILDATGALPAESAIENVIGGGKGYRQRVVAAPGIALPDMAFSREGILENLSGGAPAAIGTLGKVNNNPFTLSGGIAVTNILSVSGNGAVSFAADTAAYAGLYMAATNFSTTKATAQTEVQSYFGISGKINNASNARGTLTEPMLKDMAAKLLADIPNEEVATPDLAYRAWTGDEAQRFAAYRGHFLNTEGTNVVASFATSIADIAAVWIDGDCVVMNVGSKALTGGSSSTYFVTLGEAELTPGSHEIEILLGHIATSSNGPKSLVAGDVAAGVDWQVANFGLGWRLGGIDPSATTNAADYAAISNTADRLLLVREAGDALGASRPAVKAISVAVADNALSFGADSLALPYEVADFTGTTEITSGALRVTNRWTLAAADVAARPLSVASGASLDLTGTTLFSPDWRALGRIAH